MILSPLVDCWFYIFLLLSCCSCTAPNYWLLLTAPHYWLLLTAPLLIVAHCSTADCSWCIMSPMVDCCCFSTMPLIAGGVYVAAGQWLPFLLLPVDVASFVATGFCCQLVVADIMLLGHCNHCVVIVATFVTTGCYCHFCHFLEAVAFLLWPADGCSFW